MHKGFTLIEIMVSITLMTILVGTYFLVANPAGQLASARNSQRLLYMQAIMNAIYQNRYDQSNEQFSCAAGSLPIGTSSAKFMASASTSANYNIGPCLVPTYGISAMPFDPSASSSYYNSPNDYNSGFKVSINTSGTVITLSAPYAELGKTVSVAR